MQYRDFLYPFGEHHSFQTFCDKGKNKGLIKQLHGTIDQHIQELTALNKKGAGVYFTVNQTNLEGRTTKHITKVRAVFCDFDGTPMPDKFDIPPHFIINTSPNKFHTYWLVEDMPLESFTLYQQALASKFGSDRSVKDLPRLLRIAGFWHNKKKPYPVKIIQQNIMPEYTMEDIRDGLGLQRPKKKVIKYNPTNFVRNKDFEVRGVGLGGRHEYLVRMLVAMRMRGETYEYAKDQVLTFANRCNPPESYSEVMFQLNDIWRRYGTS